MEHLAEKTKHRNYAQSDVTRSSDAESVPPLHPLLQLQQQAGNQAVQAFLRSHVIQAKLAVSQPDDPAEREADQTADRIMRAHAGAPCNCAAGGAMCEECQQNQGGTVARKVEPGASQQTSHAGADPLLRSSGQPLDVATRRFFERHFGRDLGDVRIHSDADAAASARSIDALAYTHGRDIAFGAGQYQPGTETGQRLLAHELAHAVQQSGTPEPMIQRKLGWNARSGCSVVLSMDIGIYGSRATAGLATTWEGWLNKLWNGTSACHGNSAGTCATRVAAKVNAHPDINWWWKVPEANSAYVREAGYRSQTNTAIDSGDWAEDSSDRVIAHEVGHLMGQGDKYWDSKFLGYRSKSDFVNDIMANFWIDPGPTEYGPALSRILEDHDIDCLCCVKYPPCSQNNCALSPGLPCAVVGEKRHCEWIVAHNTPEAVAQYGVDCSKLTH